MEISWHEAKRQFPDAIEALFDANGDRSEAEVAFGAVLDLDDDVLWCDERFVPCDSWRWVPGTGWVEGNYPDDYEVMIKAKEA